MGVFSRFMDIVNSNINALLDQAEDPVKMVRLMISEMEDTIIEIKTNCASAIGATATGKRKAEELQAQVDRWQQRAELAISRGRDDLAKEALVEKKHLSEELAKVVEENRKNEEAVEKFKQEISRLEDKLAGAKVKYQSMMEAAAKKACEEKDEKKKDSRMDHFDRMEDRIDKMNAAKARAEDLENRFREFEKQQDVQSELDELKKKMNIN